MKHDGSKRALWTGLVLSLSAFFLHSTDTVSMEGMNPLALAGCATTGSNYVKPTSPPPGVSKRPVKLFRKGKYALMPRRLPIYVFSKNKRYGPVLLYGAGYRQKVLYVSGPTGMILSYPFADIREIQVIKEGNAAKGAGWGALVGGLALGVIPVLSDGTKGVGTGAAFIPFCAAVGAATGAGAGAISGAISDIDDRYTIRPGKWQFHIPPMEVPPVEEKPPEVVDEKPAAAADEKPAEAVEEKPAESTVEKPAEPTVEKPTEPTEEKKGKTVKDWLEKKKKESTSDEKEE